MLKLENLIKHLFELNKRKQLIIICAFSLMLFIPFIGKVHLFDWDEINFAEMSREMRLTGEYFKVQVNYEPFYEKPPLFAWVQNLSFTVWGVNEFGARFPNAITGIACLALLFLVGAHVINRKFGLIWSLCYASGLLPFFFFKTGLIDPIFNFCIFSSLIYFIFTLNNENRKGKHFFLVGIINGVGILAKGPVALLILGLTVTCYWLVFDRKRSFLKFSEMVFFGLGILLMAGVWFGPETILRGPKFIEEFVTYMIGLLSQDIATHGQPFYYHFVVIFIGCFPLSIFGLKNLYKSQSEKYDFNRWMIMLFWVVLILFSLVKTKIINYSSLTYYPLSFLAAYTIYQYYQSGKMKQTWFFLIMGLLLSLPIAIAPAIFNQEAFLDVVFKGDRFGRESIGSMQLPMYTVYVGAIWVIATLTAFFLYRKGKILTGVVTYCLLFGIFMNAALFSILPPVEEAVQGGSIKFFKDLQGKQVYLDTDGFKSYGKYFYSKRPASLSGFTLEELYDSKKDLDTYIVIKPKRLKKLERFPEFELIDHQGGFYLFKREAQ